MSQTEIHQALGENPAPAFFSCSARRNRSCLIPFCIHRRIDFRVEKPSGQAMLSLIVMTRWQTDS
jgi:hypothetical protein